MVLGDLLGPAGGESEELTERTVRDRYLVGVLAPSRSANAAAEPSVGEEEEEEEDNGPSPTPGYVFASFFAVLYVGGRLLEQWLIRSVFRKRLSGVPLSGREAPLAK